jgi:hypothetical protein
MNKILIDYTSCKEYVKDNRKTGIPITISSPIMCSKYVPHQGAREKARRVRISQVKDK